MLERQHCVPPFFCLGYLVVFDLKPLPLYVVSLKLPIKLCLNVIVHYALNDFEDWFFFQSVTRKYARRHILKTKMKE